MTIIADSWFVFTLDKLVIVGIITIIVGLLTLIQKVIPFELPKWGFYLLLALFALPSYFYIQETFVTNTVVYEGDVIVKGNEETIIVDEDKWVWSFDPNMTVFINREFWDLYEWRFLTKEDVWMKLELDIFFPTTDIQEVKNRASTLRALNFKSESDWVYHSDFFDVNIRATYRNELRDTFKQYEFQDMSFVLVEQILDEARGALPQEWTNVFTVDLKLIEKEE
ncbi:hypothetical protein [Alkalihalobacillus pseudalcaliphilus]|uniref:hypothetical protein n=1 Tax=Alkalihalobacillus pseudalcaliphilus TaxID=79884 RepID=UPI00064D73CE|nr:hypothetical protein [Alkalihalobacillus pseudalcaliphilus]KMK75804.1 hypothetical protein AB990_11085 [Alkalihalobacillus pseudalcaliphilus]